MESVGNVGNSAPVAAASNESSFSTLDSQAFIRLLIAQLQNQDPTEPLGNEELLSQISMMQGLQSDVELAAVLKSFSTSQQLSQAATLIGKSVTGTSLSNQEVTGIVERAFVKEGEAFVAIGGEEIPINNVTSVNLA